MRNGNGKAVMPWHAFLPYWRHDAWQKFKLVNLALLCIILTTTAFLSMGFSKDITLWMACTISSLMVLLGLYYGEQRKDQHNEVKLNESNLLNIYAKFLSNNVSSDREASQLPKNSEYIWVVARGEDVLLFPIHKVKNIETTFNTLMIINHPERIQHKHMQELFYKLICMHGLEQESNIWVSRAIQEMPRKDTGAALLNTLSTLNAAAGNRADFNPTIRTKVLVELSAH